MNARGVALLFAMLANQGELDGVRLLSAERVRSFSKPRPNTDDQPDAILGFPVRVGTAGYWLGGPTAPAVVGSNPHTLHHPGAGGSIGWANPETRTAGAICHNRMFNAPDDPFAPIVEAIRRLLASESGQVFLVGRGRILIRSSPAQPSFGGTM